MKASKWVSKQYQWNSLQKVLVLNRVLSVEWILYVNVKVVFRVRFLDVSRLPYLHYLHFPLLSFLLEEHKMIKDEMRNVFRKKAQSRCSWTTLFEKVLKNTASPKLLLPKQFQRTWLVQIHLSGPYTRES